MEVSPDSTTQTLNMYDYINNFLMTPSVFIILFIVIAAYIILFLAIGKSSTSNSSSSDDSSSESTSGTGTKRGKVFGIIMLGLLLLLVVINGLQYFFGIDIMASIKNLTSGSPEIDIKVDTSNQTTVPSIIRKKQVFNIPGNYYGYNDASALCQAYGARLATYSEVEKAYNKGAEWCNYGWSDGQMALFPTQQKTYDELQKIEGHENDCGRPGINGGYIANPRVQFGANCYGYKPRMTNEEKELMLNTEKYPKNLKDLAMEKRVDYWKDKISEILVSPFNHDTWSKV